MSYPIVITENLSYPCDNVSLRTTLMNFLEHLMDPHLSADRMTRLEYGFPTLEIGNPNDFITDGTGLVETK